jgi:tRNA (guanine-N7-)-methyltransferase
MRSRPGKVRVKTDLEVLRSAGLLLEYEPRLGPLRLSALFGNESPVEVEVGPGKGGFLLGRASARPEINLLGVEWIRAYAAYVADRAYRAGLPNVRTICVDAADFFQTSLPDGSVSRVHIYFPDPWPKRRHRRRRLIKSSFLLEVRRVLCPGGQLAIVTDDADYYGHIRQVVSATDRLEEIPFEPCPEAEGLVGSNFERKYSQAGKTFHALAAMRS